MSDTNNNYYYILCSDVVRLERPDLEKQRNELILNINMAKNELKVSTKPKGQLSFGLVI